VATLTPLSKEDKILIISLQECKGHNAWQFITAFMNKGWTKMVKFGTVVRRRAAADAERILIKTSTQLSRCCWVRKTNLRAKRNFTWGGGSIDHQFRRLFTKFCVSSVTRKGALNIWLKRTAYTRYFRYAVASLIDDNVITSKPTWQMKHAHSISRVFWIFLPNIIKIDPYNFELYCFKVGPFFETQYFLAELRPKLRGWRSAPWCV